MEFVSKYNLTFINFVNKKYSKKFQSFENYSLWLYETNDCKGSKYYYELEEDLKKYCEFQDGRKKKNGKSKS